MKNINNVNENNAAKWAEDALESLNGIQRATANPFLYTRIAARLESGMSVWEKVARLLSRPAFAVASIVIFLSINIAVIMWGEQKSKNELAQKLNSEQLLASEFVNTQNFQLVDINE
jgi:hypothetical protein